MMNMINAAKVKVAEVPSAKIVPFKSPSDKAVDKSSHLSSVDTGDTEKSRTSSVERLQQIEEQRRLEEAQKNAEEEKSIQEKLNEAQEEKVTQKMLDELAQDFDILHSVGLSFSQHEATGRTMVKVMNLDNDELIREVPAEKVLDMAAKMEEMIGLLFDVKV